MWRNALSAKQVLCSVVVVACACSAALGDGMIVPIRPDLRVRGEWAVKYHHVDIKVHDQVAEVSVDQAFVNLGPTDLEVEYMFPVPPDSAIDRMTLMADGKELPGRLMKADEARKTFEEIVRRKKDPALLEYVGYGLYKTSVFPLPPGKERRVLVHYTTLCKKDRGMVEVFYPLNTEKFSARGIDDVTVTVDIQAHSPIGTVYSPSHELQITRPEADRVQARYQVKNAIPTADFRLLCQDGGGDVSTTLLSYRPSQDRDGYFMLLVSPPLQAAETVIPKDIVLVLDHSGSMSGQKLDQAKEALKWILQSLNPKDRFNVLSFSDSSETLFTDKLVDADSAHLDKARQWVERIDATGGTNIRAAAEQALGLLPPGTERPAYVLFLTDGQPTVGDTSENGILAAAREGNKSGARIFGLGIGYDVNARLVDKLSQENHGLSDYVKPNESLEGKISGLYAKIRNPVMTKLKVDLPGMAAAQTYPRELGDLFDGQQLVVVGRYSQGGKATLKLSGTYQGSEKTFEYPVELDERSEDKSYAFLERIWAMRRVGFLMDQIALNGQNKELVDELVGLSKDYGIVTPYTSFLADENANLADSGALLHKGAEAAQAINLGSVSGEGAQRSAMARQSLGKSMVLAAPAAAASDRNVSYGLNLGQMVGNTSQDKYERNEQESLDNMRQVNGQTLYRRGRQWYTPELAGMDVSKNLPNVKVVRQYTDEYFALVANGSLQDRQVLATQQAGEELLVNVNGQAYRILPPEG